MQYQSRNKVCRLMKVHLIATEGELMIVICPLWQEDSLWLNLTTHVLALALKKVKITLQLLCKTDMMQFRVNILKTRMMSRQLTSEQS